MKLDKKVLRDFGSIALKIEDMLRDIRNSHDFCEIAYLVNNETFTEQTPYLKVRDGKLYLSMDMYYYNYQEDKEDSLEVEWSMEHIFMESIEVYDDGERDEIIEKVKEFPPFKIITKS